MSIFTKDESKKPKKIVGDPTKPMNEYQASLMIELLSKVVLNTNKLQNLEFDKDNNLRIRKDRNW